MATPEEIAADFQREVEEFIKRGRIGQSQNPEATQRAVREQFAELLSEVMRRHGYPEEEVRMAREAIRTRQVDVSIEVTYDVPPEVAAYLREITGGE